MTPEDLAKLKAIREGTVPAPEIAIPQIDPQSASVPYNKTAADYTAKADTYQKAAEKPQEAPVGAKQNLVASLRNAMENMGRWGAPGGYYGQEEKRTQDYNTERNLNLTQADKLRAIAEKQQGLGINAENEARQQNYNEGQLAETAALRKRQEESTQEQIRHNNAVETNLANTPLLAPAGTAVVSKQTGQPLYTNPAKQGNLRLHQFQGADPTKPEIWSIDNEGQKVALQGYGTLPGQGGANDNQFLQSTDANGNPVYMQGNKRTGVVNPAHMAGDPNAAVPTADAGKKNVQNDAKIAADYETAKQSFSAMAGLAQKRDYPSDQAMADAFFNIIKPGSGARMNDAAIKRYLTPGPLTSKMLVWAQKLSTGAPLDDVSRMEMLQAAQTVLNSKKPVPRAGAQPAAGWSVQEVH